METRRTSHGASPSLVGLLWAGVVASSYVTGRLAGRVIAGVAWKLDRRKFD